MQTPKLVFKTIAVMFATVVSRILGFLRTVVLAAVFGITWQTDAFYMATDVVGMVSGISSSGIASAIVPMRTQKEAALGREEADIYTSSIANLMLLFSSVLALVSFFFAGQIVRIFAPSFYGEQLSETIRMFQIMSILIVISAIISVFTGVLNSHHRYLPPQLIGISLSVVSIGFALLFGELWGVNAMIAGFTIGTALQVSLIIPPLKGIFRYRMVLQIKNPDLFKTFVFSIPIFISIYADTINHAVNKALASGLPLGSISAMTYANQLVGLFAGVLITPITTTLFTMFSQLAAKDDIEHIKQLLTKVGGILIVALAPVTMLCMLFAPELVAITFQRGSFNQEATNLTSSVFLFMMLSLAPWGLRVAISKCFIALKDSITPLICTVIGIAINIALNFMLIIPMGVNGLALASSISAMVISILLLVALRRKVGALGLSLWIKNGICAFIACIPMMFAALFLARNIHAHVIIRTGVAGIAGILVYTTALWLFGYSELREFIKKVSLKLANRKS